jgi:5-hydroxyisourate hydrolase-like protein (transthyretin family)
MQQLPSRALIVSALLLCAGSLSERANSQTKTETKTTEATVSGKVTVKGKPAAGIVVGMRLARPDESSSSYKAKTDQEGVYHIAKVTSGNYLVAPVAPNFVIAEAGNNPQGQTVVITENENVDGINFDLTPGGVITGKVVDSEGHPVIEERVMVMPADERDQRRPVINNSGMATDDRGVYRLFGMPAGRYKLWVGDPRVRSRRRLTPTFYPDVNDAAKAGIVEVKEGAETNKIDITVGEAPQGYSVTGRIVDGESGNPVAGVFVQLNRIEVNGSSGSNQYLDTQSDAQGKFRLSNVGPGKYDVNIYPGEDSNVRVDAPVKFDLIDQDVSDLVIKTSSSGATITGTVVFEGGKNTPAQGPRQMWISIYTRTEANTGGSYGRSARVKPDGTFFAGGFTAGIANFNVQTQGSTGFTLTRVERDGVVQPNGIQIQNGEHVSGVRLVLTFSSGIVRGVVRVENGTLPPGARMTVQIIKAGEQNPMNGAEVDARGHFLIEGLPAGSYEVRAIAYAAEFQRRGQPVSVKQIVTVNEGAATDVTLTLDLTPVPNQ